jgi:polyisoprenoid-binding protein YceI
MMVNTSGEQITLTSKGARSAVAVLEIVSKRGMEQYSMKYRARTFASAAFFVTSLALARHTWILDSSRSNARLFQGARADSELANCGVARVTGTVKLDTNDLDASFFDLSIYPADEDWGYSLSPEGTLPIGYVPDATDQTLLTFKSTSILGTGNGRLEVIGNLTLTRVDRTVIAVPAEAYDGPAYGGPIIHNETREITFLFPSVSAEHLSTPLIPAMTQKRGVLEIIGSARVDRDEFPELFSAIKESNWPAVVPSKDRHRLSTVGEDYSGAPCTGTVVAATRDNNCDVLASAGEDYSDPQYTPATGNQTTMVLDLKFLHTVPEPSVGMLLESGETR